MADPLDLTGEIAEAIEGAALRGKTVVLGYVDEEGYAAMSFRGSAQVHRPTQLAVWSRKADEGLVTSIGTRPKVSLLYFGGADSPGPKFLSIRGTAHVDPSANDEVYDRMVQGERDQDPEHKGVAVLIDVQSVRGFGADGAFEQSVGS
jgi:hypothetical protein